MTAGSWIAKALGKTQPVEEVTNVQRGMALLLILGRNTFGDDIYTYMRLPMQDIDKVKEIISSGQPFVPGHHGTVIAAGRGIPSPEVRAENGTPDFMLYFEPKTLPNQRPQG